MGNEKKILYKAYSIVRVAIYFKKGTANGNN